MAQTARTVRRTTTLELSTAVQRSKPLSKAGLQEWLFTRAFSGLVYPQIWEDPVVDMDALSLKADDHVVAIASGSCNILSYLTAAPIKVSAVDLNGAHIALGRLKLAALARMQSHADFLRFFGRADDKANVAFYDREIAPHLDAVSRSYWEGRGLDRRRRVNLFAKGFYRHGLLGRFIGTGPGRAARALRDASGSGVPEAAGALAGAPAGLALRARHSAGAIQGARGRWR